MRINEKTIISADKVRLMPYEAHHVLQYHAWMQDPKIQEATASEPLSLQEEYENQTSWRQAHDKLTFIICAPEPIGDINFFFHRDGIQLRGEIDVMIAEGEFRGRGLGRAAVETLMVYLCRNRGRLVAEYVAGEDILGQSSSMQLEGALVRIKEENEASRALFGKLGFEQEGAVNYFGEVEMGMRWERVERLVASVRGTYREMETEH